MNKWAHEYTNDKYRYLYEHMFLFLFGGNLKTHRYKMYNIVNDGCRACRCCYCYCCFWLVVCCVVCCFVWVSEWVCREERRGEERQLAGAGRVHLQHEAPQLICLHWNLLSCRSCTSWVEWVVCRTETIRGEHKTNKAPDFDSSSNHSHSSSESRPQLTDSRQD